MRRLQHFEYRDNIMLNAAQIGVSKWRWDFVDADCNKEAAMSIMKEKKYDVLPIIDADGNFTSFYSTWSWGEYDELNRNQIDSSRCIYYKMSFRDLVKKFAEKADSRFFFLETHDEIIGLVSTVNFNTLPVYNYLYREIADIEYRVSSFLESQVPETDVVITLNESNDKLAQELVENYLSTSSSNQNSNIFQHLFLPNLGLIIGKHKMDFPEPQRKLASYARSFSNEYRELRNLVAHPVRPVITGQSSFISLSKILNDFDEIRNILEKK
jgi:hypothetical protein